MPWTHIFTGEALLATLEGAATPMIACDLDGIIRYTNPAVTAMFGHEREAMVGQDSEMLIPLESRPAQRALRDAWAKNPVAVPNSGNVDARGLRSDGSVFPIEIVITPVPSNIGMLALVAFVDISARLAGEHQARYLSRAHLAMAELNDAAARADDPDDLLEAGLAAFRRIDERATLTVVREGMAEDCSAAVAHALRRAVSEPWLRVWPTDDGACWIAVLPITTEDRVILRVVISTTDATMGEPEARAVLDTMAGNLSLGLDRLAQRDRLRRVDSQRLELFRRLLDVQERERRQIADDVHDDSVQALAALQLRTSLLEHQVGSDRPEIVDGFAQLEGELDRVMASLRNLIFDLEPVSTSTVLTDVVAEVLDRAQLDEVEVRRVVVDWSAAPVGDDLALLDLAPELRGQAARILKEALRNVARHARATSVTVTITPDPDGVEIALADDGVGPAAVDTSRSAPGHRGVSGMIDQASLSGGWCRLEREGDRTTLRFWLPRTGPTTEQLAQSAQVT